jgi:nucleoside-diphosphate-sugar epimerase
MKGKVLVTGGAGYIGSVLVRHLLQEGYHVRALDNLMYTGKSLLGCLGHPAFEFLYGDISNAALIEKVFDGMDQVVHLAAIVGDPASNKDIGLTRRVNQEASIKLIDKAVEQGISKFIFASTCSNYGVSDPESYATEEFPLKPLSPYAESKVAVEQYLAASDRSLNYTILRFATAYGVSPRMRFDLTINDFTMQMATKGYLMVYGKEFWRPYVHIMDIAPAVQLVLEKPGKSYREVFNVGANHENYRKMDIVDIIARYVPNVKVEFQGIGSDRRDYRVSFDKVKRVLGFSPMRTIENGIKEVLQVIQGRIITDFDNREYYNA